MTRIKMYGKINIILVLFICLNNLLKGQEFDLNSNFLGTSRNISIFLPKDYSPNKSYLSIYVLDGRSIGNLVYGITSFQNSYGLSQEVIVVSVNNDSTRWDDCGYDKSANFTLKGDHFKDFLFYELIPYVDSNYSTSKCRAIIGHSLSATFISLMQIEDNNPFSAFLCVSPYYTSKTINKINNKLRKSKTFNKCYISYGENDFSAHIVSIKKFKKQLTRIRDLEMKIDIIEEKGHTGMLPLSIQNGINFWLKRLGPIYKLYDLKKLKQYHSSYENFYLNHYNTMEKEFNIKVEPIKEDLQFLSFAAAKYCSKMEKFEFGKFCVKLYPNYFVGYYVLGDYYRSISKLEEALGYYEKGYSLLGEDCLNKMDFYHDIEKIKAKIKS